jgi:GAF domain-containing protein
VLTVKGGYYKDLIPGEYRIPISQGLMGEAARTRQMVLVNDVASDPRYLPTPGGAAACELAVPILLGDRVLGVVNVERDDPFREEDAAIVGIIADQLAVAHARPPRLVELSQVALDEMRVLLAELRPRGRYTAEHEAPAGSARSRLRHHGLAEALSLLAAEVSCDALPVDAELAGYRPRPLAQEEALYRIAQEGLNNVVKHARATYAQLRLASEGGSTVLSLIDDGVGFTTSVEATGEHAIQMGGLGLLTMRERATAVGGTIRVESSPGGGTTIEVTVPADAEPRA